jgi:hypothetical protein
LRFLGFSGNFWCGLDVVAVLYKQVEWIVALDEEAGPVVAMEWRVEVESVVVGRSSGQVIKQPTFWTTLCPFWFCVTELVLSAGGGG